MPPQVTASRAQPDEVSCDALVIGATKGKDGVSLSPGGRRVDDALDGYLSEYLASIGFKAGANEVEVVATGRQLPARAVAVVGLGDPGSLDAAALRAAAGTAARKLAERPALASILHESAGEAASVEPTVEGFLLGLYRFVTYKTDAKGPKTETIEVLAEDGDAAVERARVIAEAVALARDLTNEPASTLTPEMFAARAREVADVAGLACEVFDEQALRDGSFGGLLGVAQGSARPPRLIHLHYEPDNPKGKVALVGKGITFDSGGLSIKDARSMETMKTDMAGAAAVLATMSALGRIGAEIEVDAYIATSENLTGGRALKPGDVIVHRGGRTTEVNNTDAEGRLVLSDALVYACEKEPDAVVDAATLTGGIVIALGWKSTGLFSNDDALASELQDAAQQAGERMWRMPIYDDLKSDLESEVADMKNSGGRYGSSIIGALFLKQFVKRGTPWAHLDIAGTARAQSDSGEVLRGGTGVALRTFLTWIEGRGR